MPPTLNHFLDAQEEFWIAVMEDFEQHEIAEFRKFFNPLFYLPDNISIADNSHPLNKYGADRSTNENMSCLRETIENNCDACPTQLLSYMFEDDDHSIYEELVEMLRRYRELGNYMRDNAHLDSDTSDTETESDDQVN